MDWFDSDTFHQTPAFSEIPPPLSQLKTSSNWTTSKRPQAPRPKTFQVSHEQEARRVECNGSLVGLLTREDLSLQTYQVTLDSQVSEAHLDYFSRPHNRAEVLSLTERLSAQDKERVKHMKREVNPYSSVKNCLKFEHPGAVLMANLKSLHKGLITQNFTLSSFDFVTIGDSGGLSEFILKDFQASNYGDIRGWSVFPKKEFSHDNVENLTGPVSFAELERHIAYISDQTGFASCMLLVGDLCNPKTSDFVLKEKLAKSQLSLYVYSALKLLTKGGTLVFKCHSTWLPSTCELLFYISRAFSHFSIVKPYCSPAHTFERFVVCEGFLEKEADIEATQQLCRVLERLGEMQRDLEHVVELSKVVKDTAFQDYLLEENSRLAEQQIIALRTVLQGLTEGKPPVYDKSEIAMRCHIHWGLAEAPQHQPVSVSAPVYIPRAPTYSSVPLPQRRHRSPDLSKCEDIISRHLKPSSEKPTFASSARPLPKQITAERTVNLETYTKQIETNLAKTFLGRVLNPNKKSRGPKKQ